MQGQGSVRMPQCGRQSQVQIVDCSRRREHMYTETAREVPAQPYTATSKDLPESPAFRTHITVEAPIPVLKEQRVHGAESPSTVGTTRWYVRSADR